MLLANFHRLPILFSLLHTYRYLQATIFLDIRRSFITRELQESARRESEREATAQWHGPVDAQCTRGTTKTTNPSSPVGERLKGLHRGSALCIIVAPAPGGLVSTPIYSW